MWAGAKPDDEFTAHPGRLIKKQKGEALS